MPGKWWMGQRIIWMRPRCSTIAAVHVLLLSKTISRSLFFAPEGEWPLSVPWTCFLYSQGCGVRNVELVKPLNLKTDWISANASDSPWNVAIYKREKKNMYLHCCGTLISTYMVVSGENSSSVVIELHNTCNLIVSNLYEYISWSRF